MDSLHMLRVENAPMHDSAVYCLLHMKSANAYKPKADKPNRKRRWNPYPTEFYDYTLRETVLNIQAGVCLLESKNCDGRMTFHHIDKDKTNNHVDNLAYMCIEHHFGVHINKYRIPIGGIN